MHRTGVTMIELLMALVIFSLVMTAVFTTFSQGRKGAEEAMTNLDINMDLQRISDRLQGDIREASGVGDQFPPFLVPGVEKTKKTDDPDNSMVLYKVEYDFKKLPPFAGNDKFFTIWIASYSLKQDLLPAGSPPTTASRPYYLLIESHPLLPTGALDPSKRVLETLNQKGKDIEIDRLIFYRYKATATTAAGTKSIPTGRCVFFDLAMTRYDKKGTYDEKYTGKITTSVQVRGSMPEGL